MDHLYLWATSMDDVIMKSALTNLRPCKVDLLFLVL